MILFRAFALCFYPHQWKFSSTPVRTVFAINTTEFYHPHRTIWSDVVKRSDLAIVIEFSKNPPLVVALYNAYFLVGKRSEVRGAQLEKWGGTASWNRPLAPVLGCVFRGNHEVYGANKALKPNVTREAQNFKRQPT